MAWREEMVCYDFFAGTHTRAYELLGAHRVGAGQYVFRLYAPHAQRVEVRADFLPDGRLAMYRTDPRGLWEASGETQIPAEGMVYAFCLDGDRLCADPYARRGLYGGMIGSILGGTSRYVWQDGAWMRSRGGTDRPISVYRVHLSSFATRQGRSCAGGDAYLHYRDLGELLATHAADMGFTHIRLMPLTEHPQDSSLGYLSDGYFAPTARHGTPDDLRGMIDRLHGCGIGVIMDLPLSRHAPSLACGGVGDGFDLTIPAVQSFLLSAAFFWLREYHLDGLCLCGLPSAGEEAVSFVRGLSAALHGAFPDVLLPADGGVGWEADLWPHRRFREDLLACLNAPPPKRACFFDRLSLSLQEASDYGRICLLSLSEETVHGGRRALVAAWQGSYLHRFATARLALAYQLAHPGKKELFMGDELGQLRSWDGTVPPDWFLRELETHAAFCRDVRRMNYFYRAEPRLWQSERASLEQLGEDTLLIRRGEGALLCLFHVGEERTLCRCPVGQGVAGVRILLWIGGESGEYRDGVTVVATDGTVLLDLPPLSACFCEPVEQGGEVSRAFILPPRK